MTDEDIDTMAALLKTLRDAPHSPTEAERKHHRPALPQPDDRASSEARTNLRNYKKSPIPSFGATTPP